MARILRLFGIRRRSVGKGDLFVLGPRPRALGDKLQILARTNPEGLRVLERLVDDMISRPRPGA